MARASALVGIWPLPTPAGNPAEGEGAPLLGRVLVDLRNRGVRDIIEDKKRSDQPARLVEGQRVMGWREAPKELDIAYPGRLR